VFVRRIELHDFRSYPSLELELEPGVVTFLGANGQGKTNIVEAVDYVARLGSHRVSNDQALVRSGSTQALVRVVVQRDSRQAVVEIEIVPGKSNRARVNRSPLSRARDALGWVQTVVFSPEDLSIVKGDPAARRGFLDDLVEMRAPRMAGVRSDYDKLLRQRNTLLKSGRDHRRRSGGVDEHFDSTWQIWSEQLGQRGAEIVLARQGLVKELAPLVDDAYADVAHASQRQQIGLSYDPSTPLPDGGSRDELAAALLQAMSDRKAEELDRGVTLVGPHRDDLDLSIGDLPVRGYASHGETWSFALALRLAAFDLLRATGDDPILILDDVFAELDEGRRERLASRVSVAEQVLITAAVASDVPDVLNGLAFDVQGGMVRARG
jgi:DNA replication and repair protein RecF